MFSGNASSADANTALPTKKKKNKKKTKRSMGNKPEEPLPLSGIEEVLGHRYQFRDPKLLEEAMTHPSCNQAGFNYDKLEFIGDAMINWLIVKQLYFSYPDLDQGRLTRLRAANVDTEKFARVSIKHDLHRYLRHKMEFFERQVQDFNEAIKDHPMHSQGLIDTPKFLADIVESMAGAVFIDSNYSLDTVWKVFRGLLEPLISPEELGDHPMTELQELCQKRGVTHKFDEDSWEENATIYAIVDDHSMGSGTGPSKEIARTRAAKDALDNIK